MSHSPAASETNVESWFRQERREAPRYPCRARGHCRPVTANETGNCWPVDVIDISTGNVGLLVNRRFEPGTLLALELCRDSKEWTYLPLARVCRAIPAGPLWLLGCIWQGILSGDDVQPLIGAADLWQAARAQVRQALSVSRRALRKACKTY